MIGFAQLVQESFDQTKLGGNMEKAKVLASLALAAALAEAGADLAGAVENLANELAAIGSPFVVRKDK